MAHWRAAIGEWARAAKRDAIAVYLAARDPRVPLPVKAFAALIAAYALSPIDLIPDFIPVIGFLDEIVLLPAAIWMIARLIDPAVMAEHRSAAALIAARPVSRWGAAIVVLTWLAVAALVAALVWTALG